MSTRTEKINDFISAHHGAQLAAYEPKQRVPSFFITLKHLGPTLAIQRGPQTNKQKSAGCSPSKQDLKSGGFHTGPPWSNKGRALFKTMVSMVIPTIRKHGDTNNNDRVSPSYVRVCGLLVKIIIPVVRRYMRMYNKQ